MQLWRFSAPRRFCASFLGHAFDYDGIRQFMLVDKVTHKKPGANRARELFRPWAGKDDVKKCDRLLPPTVDFPSRQQASARKRNDSQGSKSPQLSQTEWLTTVQRFETFSQCTGRRKLPKLLRKNDLTAATPLQRVTRPRNSTISTQTARMQVPAADPAVNRSHPTTHHPSRGDACNRVRRHATPVHLTCTGSRVRLLAPLRQGAGAQFGMMCIPVHMNC